MHIVALLSAVQVSDTTMIHSSNTARPKMKFHHKRYEKQPAQNELFAKELCFIFLPVSGSL